MPELPDVTVYCERIDALLGGAMLERVRIRSPFLLRTVEPPLAATHGKRLVGVRRLGKRIVLALEDELFIVIHLMIAGRLKWRKAGAKIPGKVGLAALDFPDATLLFTEASSRKRASLHVVAGEAGLVEHGRGGLSVLEADLDAFAERLRSRNHTLKRALTDQSLFDGIGNAFSDEILHAARLSPVVWTQRLDDDAVARLFVSCREVLVRWIERTREVVGDGFPEKVTAFREGMAVHGRYGEPCPACGAPVQRITYVEKNEVNYCARCQTGGKMLSDRSLARLLKGDWPRTIDELEERRAARGARDARR